MTRYRIATILILDIFSPVHSNDATVSMMIVLEIFLWKNAIPIKMVLLLVQLQAPDGREITEGFSVMSGLDCDDE